MDELPDEELLENISVPVAYFDADGGLARSNRAWEMLLCEPSDALLILTYDDLVEQFRLPPFDEMQLQDHFKTTFGLKTIVVIRRRILMMHSKGIMVEVNDISTLEQNMTLIDSTINDVMWKIRSRVASVQNVLTLLVDYSKNEYSAQTGTLLSSTRREMWELSRHIEDLRDLTAINSGAFVSQIHGEPVNIRELLDTVRIECGPIVPIGQRSETLLFDVEPDLTVNCDRHISLKAISTVMFNAVVYADAPGLVRVSARRAEDSAVQITVHDSGWGIPHEEQDMVFSYGFRGACIRQADIAGLGVGLHLVRRMLGMINSEINFTSKPGAGSQFTILLRELGRHG